MHLNFFKKYIDNFRGFSREVWILAVVTFINRAGTMVLPFLSKYLKEDLGFSYSQVGWIMVCFGVGSLVGSWLGGKLTDKIGFYKIMIFSLMTSGVFFLFFQYITSFVGLCIGIFIIMIVADMFRPAMFVSLGTYAKPENRTRALTLVRLAVNLGIALGPALGGLIIMGIGYSGLFWVDGLSCILAIGIFALLVKEVKPNLKQQKDKNQIQEKTYIWKDAPFLFFLINSFLMAMIFFQLYTTLPLYHHDKYLLTEFQTGLLMTLNGLLIFLFEMPFVSYFEQKKSNHLKIILFGSLLMSLSFAVLLIDAWVGILIVSIVLMAFGIMFVFPFSNAFALSRAPKGKEGLYMGYYTMSFSVAHIASSKTGMEIIDNFGYLTNWMVMFLLGIIGTSLIIVIHKKVRIES
jgi:predicted MFS family arabinose efflux permease